MYIICMIFPLHLHIVNFSTHICKSFFDVGAALAVPKYSKFYLCTNIACIVLALHLQCQNIVDISACILFS